MKMSKKAIFWGLFAAGGTLAAFLVPILIIITGIAVPMGWMSPEVVSYDRMSAFAGNFFGKIIIFGVIFLLLWHAAHRLKVTAHDFGIHREDIVMIVCYGAAAVGTIATVIALLRI